MKQPRLALRKKCPAWMQDSGGEWFALCRPNKDRWDPNSGPCVIGCFPKLYCLKPTERQRVIKEHNAYMRKMKEDGWYRSFKENRKEVRKTLLADYNQPSGPKLLEKLEARAERETDELISELKAKGKKKGEKKWQRKKLKRKPAL